MEKNTKPKSEDRANIVTALARMSRVFIPDRLSGSGRSAREPADMTGRDTANIPHHLSIPLKYRAVIR